VSTEPRAEGAGGASLASPGARWTGEEDEELVAAVRAGADLAVIAAQHGRTQGAITSRLLRMIPATEAIPEEEQFGWITARLADPSFDWRTPLAHPRSGKRGSGAPASPAASYVGEVLDIWQRINGSELGGERRARFLASPELGDLVQFPVGVLEERGRRLYQACGRLLLNDWAAECAVPGLTEQPDAGDLRKVLASTGENVRRLVAAAVMAVPDEGDREVLERRLGLAGDGPQTLAQIGAHLGVSRERVRQRADRAVKAIGSARARTGYRAARAKARAAMSELISGDDSTLDPNFVIAIAELSFPGARPENVAQVIMHIAGASTAAQPVSGVQPP